MKKLIFLAILLFPCLGAGVGNFEWKSDIGSIPKTGFYKILLSPEMISGMNSSYADIRIFDSKHKEIPYLFGEEQAVRSQTGFKEYKIIENHHLQKPAITRVVIHNDEKRIISRFVIIVRNSEVEKEITLKGSDDQKNWFIVKHNYPVSSPEFNGTTSEMRILDFPKSSYEFFELTLNDKQKDLLQILKVGYYESENHLGSYTEVPSPAIHQKDSAQVKKSFINLKFKNAFELSRLKLQVKGPEFYKRTCFIGHYVNQKHRTIFEIFDRFTISSKSNVILDLGKIKTDELTLVIENEDNPPIRVVSVKGYFLNKYLITYLKSGESYDLYFGNKELRPPEYDLKYFADSIKGNVPIVKMGRVVSIKAAKAPAISLIFNKTFLWIAIVLVIGLLAWYSVKLIKEMGKNI